MKIYKVFYMDDEPLVELGYFFSKEKAEEFAKRVIERIPDIKDFVFIVEKEVSDDVEKWLEGREVRWLEAVFREGDG